MTREKAIEDLKILKEDYWDDDGYGHETNQHDDTMLALDMAIQALEQTRWIPVGERLPEQDERGGNWQSVKVFAQIKNYAGITEIVKGCFIKFDEVMAFELDEFPLCIPDGWDCITLDKDNRAYDEDYPEEYVELQAWMPLPKPYVPDTNIGKMSASPAGAESEGV